MSVLSSPPNSTERDWRQGKPSQLAFPGPGQAGAPFFDGNNVTDFVVMWEDLTVEWPEDLRIKRVPLYCERLIGKYVRALASYETGDWEAFKVELLAEFRDSDEEQQKYTKGYLEKLACEMRNRTETGTKTGTKTGTVTATPGEIKAYVFEFAEVSDKLVSTGVLTEHMRILVFLQGFSDKVGNKICKTAEIDVDNAATTRDKWTRVKKEALLLSAANDTQMDKIRKALQAPEKSTETTETTESTESTESTATRPSPPSSKPLNHSRYTILRREAVDPVDGFRRDLDEMSVRQAKTADQIERLTDMMLQRVSAVGGETGD